MGIRSVEVLLYLLPLYFIAFSFILSVTAGFDSHIPPFPSFPLFSLLRLF